MSKVNKMHLARTAYMDRGTPGSLSVNSDHVCYTLELPWRNNQRDISCIPEGIYPIVWKKSPSKGWRLHIKNIPGRDLCMFHVGNWIWNVLGCVMPGLELKLWDKQGDMMVTSSTVALRKLEKLIPRDETAELTVSGPPGPEGIIEAQA